MQIVLWIAALLAAGLVLAFSALTYPTSAGVQDDGTTNTNMPCSGDCGRDRDYSGSEDADQDDGRTFNPPPDPVPPANDGRG